MQLSCVYVWYRLSRSRMFMSDSRAAAPPASAAFVRLCRATASGFPARRVPQVRSLDVSSELRVRKSRPRLPAVAGLKEVGSESAVRTCRLSGICTLNPHPPTAGRAVMDWPEAFGRGLLIRSVTSSNSSGSPAYLFSSSNACTCACRPSARSGCLVCSGRMGADAPPAPASSPLSTDSSSSLFTASNSSQPTGASWTCLSMP
mmetsp:Transcript_16382/g.49308  ORF Transcript_16382/g.49308 Transcript_16382/m.49308 type:complete len:203 (-) Transcript_16382:874-1482(-)